MNQLFLFTGKNGHIRIGQTSILVFKIAFALIFFREAFRFQIVITLPDLIDKALYLTGITLMLFVVLYDAKKRTNLERLFRLVLLFSGFLSYICSGDTVGLTLMIVIVGASSINSIEAVVNYWSHLALFSTVFICFAFVIVNSFGNSDIPIYFYRSDFDLQKRLSLGFEHPNSLSSFCLMIAIAFWHSDNSNSAFFKKALLFLVFSIIVFLVTRSRAALLLSFVYILLRLLLNSERASRLFFRIKWILLSIPLVSSVAVYLLAGPFYNDILSTLFTNRVRLWHSFYINNGVSIFGQPFYSTKYTTNDGLILYSSTLDSAYAYCLFVGGCAIGLLLIVLLILYLRQASVHDMWQFAGLSIVLILGFTETTSIWIMASGPLIYISAGLQKHFSTEFKSQTFEYARCKIRKP